ncbi:MAG: NAD(P)/FAD-dependent oxidoreductase [Alphaproteobacteria bacterium]|jgi:L-2-hydroxyglutarate oxidase LhgO|nr:NAD(P)/FAD-dependent oxidoreductase [Alphaproteobacteria bacterium]MBT7943992.1 NAD(P)/FAD-dependent oxidoreductase [Alphaproteobacteria bacterium]
MTDTVDTIIIGAGVVGLAIARKMALAGDEVIVLEAEAAIGTGLSSRNSEVIHAGLYYPEGSLKGLLCRPGRDLLYGYCDSHGIPYKRLGKLIVATAENEIEALDALMITATHNGVEDLVRLSAEEAREMEPNLACFGAILSPSTGIFDSHAYMLSLQGEAEAKGGVIALSSPFAGARIEDNAIIAVRTGGTDPMELQCRQLINSAGLGANDAAAAIEGLSPEFVPPLYYAKGNYFTISGKSPFTRMIYPVPAQAGLGTHSSTDLAGQTKFGPDVQWVDQPDYVVDPARAEKFYRAIRRYWPGLPDGALQPGYVGVRPKLVAEGEPRSDWVIHGPETHGISGVVNLFGIESPGLTSSLAIADYVAGMLR